MNSDVIAMNVGGNFFRFPRIEPKSDGAIQFGQKAFGGPTMLEEEILQPRLFPALAQDIAGAKDFRHAARHFYHLVLANKDVQLQSDVWFGGEPAANAYRKTVLDNRAAPALARGASHIADFRIAAPRSAASNGHLEIAR